MIDLANAMHWSNAASILLSNVIMPLDHPGPRALSSNDQGERRYLHDEAGQSPWKRFDNRNTKLLGLVRDNAVAGVERSARMIGKQDLAAEEVARMAPVSPSPGFAVRLGRSRRLDPATAQSRETSMSNFGGKTVIVTDAAVRRGEEVVRAAPHHLPE
ncbi:hypothetical protein LK533_16560 [Sphingomonas sp. PL-96]|nr:hypothetical protein [Sphingomonas sp. PL-96]